MDMFYKKQSYVYRNYKHKKTKTNIQYTVYHE